jgi:hypothetical protein
MKYRTALAVAAPALLLSSAPADAYIYNVGPNYVNMSGTSCRTQGVTTEPNVRHHAGSTQVIPNANLQRLFCPISRRGTSFYGGKRLPPIDSPPPEVTNTEKRARISGVTIRAADASSTFPLYCFVFGTRRTDQATFYGLSKALCSQSTNGCTTVTPTWQGANTMMVTPHSSFTGTMDTVNFGVICDVPPNSAIYYLEASVTPN